MPRQYDCCVTGCTNSHNCSVVALLLGIFTALVPSNDSNCLALLIPTQFPTRFVNGQQEPKKNSPLAG